MVALLRNGATRAAWILDLLADRIIIAESGAGAYVDGRRVTATTDVPPVGEVLPGQGCAGREHPDVVTGVQHFSLFWRGLPWDHTPGALVAQEAGATVRWFDAAPYRPVDRRSGLLAAANDAIWREVHDTLLMPPPHR